MQELNDSQEAISFISLWVSIFSAIISSISAGIAFASFRTNSHLQGQMNSINASLLMDNGLRKYSDELNKLKSGIEPKMREISSQASIAYIAVLDMIDCKNIPTTELDPFSDECLSYIAEQIVTLWYHNFSSRLSFQLLNVFDTEMMQILHVKSSMKNLKGKQNFIRKLVNYFEYNVKPCKSARSHPEKFNSLLFCYHNRVSDSRNLYKESVKISQPIFNTVLLMKNELEVAGSKIDTLIDENNIEIVKVEDFPELYQSLKRYRACISVFERFHIFNSHIHLDADHLKLNQVLEILFFLFLFKTYGAWGDPRAFPV